MAVDSGSTDGTLGLLDGRVDRLIRIDNDAFNYGLTRNLGIEACRGEVVALARGDPGGPDWRVLTGDDFVNVNCAPDTCAWEEGMARCTGTPNGVTRTRRPYTNFELVIQWRHLRSAGNSGVIVWATEESLNSLKPSRLPQGIEIQMLHHGFAERYEKRTGKKGDWFTTNGDVFAVGGSKMKPFPPVSPDGSRSFPSKLLSKGVGEWNHYYVRAINGEVRLWVNGEEVSGGTGCEPRTGGLGRLTYMHLPIAVGESGLKLSKSEDAPALRRAGCGAQIVAALEFLRQAPPADLARAPLAEVWQWAITHWQPQRIAGMRTGTVHLEQGAHDTTGIRSP